MTQPDELIDFHHLKSRRGLTQLELEDEVATDLQKATGLVDGATSNAGSLNRILQLTGAPAIAEAPGCKASQLEEHGRLCGGPQPQAPSRHTSALPVPSHKALPAPGWRFSCQPSLSLQTCFCVTTLPCRAGERTQPRAFHQPWPD